MLREEAIVMQKAMRDNLHETGKDYPYRDDMIPLMKESCDMAIKALEQESCEDCISRQAVLSKIKEVCFSEEWKQFRVVNGSNGQRDFLINYIDILPSVTHKTGHWIKIKPYPLQMHDYECSECGHETDDNTENYCSECGTKMEVSKYEC